jgi:uncharacterized membrane protein YsdA (DUF1294 family)
LKQEPSFSSTKPKVLHVPDGAGPAALWLLGIKQTHESARRVPERTLFLLAAIGGSIGALLGMRVWHHKTLHRSFRIGIPAILLAQAALAVLLWLYFHGFFAGR